MEEGRGGILTRAHPPKKIALNQNYSKIER